MTDTVTEAVAETLDVLEGKTSSWLANRAIVASLSGVVGLAIGASVTYLLAAKKFESKYQRIADEQVADVKSRYSVLRKEGELSDPANLAAKYADEVAVAEVKVDEIIDGQNYRSYDKVEQDSGSDNLEAAKGDRTLQAVPEPEPVAVNIFSSDDPEKYWDEDEEAARREANPDKPYVITKEEYDLNEPDYNQITLTYYDGDDVLTDEAESPIDDEDGVAGSANLLRFGHASQDKNVVYVCNNRLGAYFEIIRSEGKYAEEVLGFIQHSDEPRLRKFRNHD